MRFNKNNIVLSFIIILLILLLFLPNIIGLIPATQIKSAAIIVIYVLSLCFILYEIYKDIRKQQYTTTVYIVLTDIVAVISYVILGYSSFVGNNEFSITILVKTITISIVSELFLSGSIIVRRLLKSQRFKKKVKGAEK